MWICRFCNSDNADRNWKCFFCGRMLASQPISDADWKEFTKQPYVEQRRTGEIVTVTKENAVVASNHTIHEVTLILARHLKGKLTKSQWIDLMGELCLVQGNKSFTETMREIANELKRNKVY